MEVSEVCVICNQLIDGTSPTATLGEKGSLSINKASQSRGDSIHSKSGQKVHQDCRRKYCNPQQVAKLLGHNIQKSGLRSSEGQFTWSTDCFFCGQPANLGRKRKSSGNDVFQVKTIEMKDKILAICRDRGDAWADTVQSRLLHVHVCMLQMQSTTKCAMVISAQGNRYQQSMIAAPKGKNQDVLKMRKGWMLSWK